MFNYKNFKGKLIREKEFRIIKLNNKKMKFSNKISFFYIIGK